MATYDHSAIEAKWHKYWEENDTFHTDVWDFSKPKYYVLDMFPYPSGVGLHAGHPEGYTATDIMSRMKRMQGYNVLHPMGYDSFGLPAEQYAVDTGNHPNGFTQKNIETFSKQLKELGFDYDWSKMIATSDPSFYKWTQWIFKKLYEAGYAKRIEMPVNWCEALGTVLSNDEVIDGKSERGGYPVEKRMMMQWVIDQPAFAEKLLDGLNEIKWVKIEIEGKVGVNGACVREVNGSYYLYFITNYDSDRLYCYDVTDVNNPKVFDAFGSDGFTTGGGYLDLTSGFGMQDANNIAIDEQGYIYICATTGVGSKGDTIFKVSSSGTGVVAQASVSECFGVAILGNGYLAACTYEGMDSKVHILNQADLTPVTVVGYDNANNFTQLGMIGNRIYMADQGPDAVLISSEINFPAPEPEPEAPAAAAGGMGGMMGFPGGMPAAAGEELYDLQPDVLYLLLPTETRFSTGGYSYLSATPIEGSANHFCCPGQPDEKILDFVLELFSEFQQWEQMIDQLTATEEWRALPDYEFLYD